MKVGDLVQFRREHSSRQGFEYCAEWLGLVISEARSRDRYSIFWTTKEGNVLVGNWQRYESFKALEVINESP